MFLYIYTVFFMRTKVLVKMTPLLNLKSINIYHFSVVLEHLINILQIYVITNITKSSDLHPSEFLEQLSCAQIFHHSLLSSSQTSSYSWSTSFSNDGRINGLKKVLNNSFQFRNWGRLNSVYMLHYVPPEKNPMGYSQGC